MTPDQFTLGEHFIEVGDGHSLYVQDWGNSKAKTPIIYLHGGPGDGVDNRNKRRFDPKTQRVIFFDQRGSGRSLPSGELAGNKTPDLVEDIEKIAKHFKLKAFVLVGGSWGSCLSLCYGIKYPKRVAGMVLDGIFLGTKDEMDWLDNGSWQDFFPDLWQSYSANVPESHKHKPSQYIFTKALGTNEAEAKQATYDFIKLQAGLLKLDEELAPKSLEEFDPGSGKIEINYLANNCFIEDNYILKHVRRLTMPIYIVQGRYDMVCRPAIAYKLQQKLPDSCLTWTINGHARQHESNNITSIFINKLIGT